MKNNMDIKQLRTKFFRECCAKQEDGLQDVNVTPHNTFQWFVKHFTRTECKQCSKATDELICHSCASNDYDKKYSKEDVENLLFSLAEHYAMTSTKGEIKDFNKFIEKRL